MTVALKTSHPLVLVILLLGTSSHIHAAWQHHFIDRSSRGADGVKLSDVNGDGLQDIAVGWEEGGLVRVYLNPGPTRSRQSWPMVTVGRARDAEDAVFVDLDGDGSVDVVSSSEGRQKTVQVHWAPKRANQYLNENAWTTEIFAATDGLAMFMYAQPLQIDNRHGIDLMVGTKAGKDPRVGIGWLESPANPRDVSAYVWHEISDAQWIMSMKCIDMDDDGDQDLLVSDRKSGNLNGVRWLENPNRVEEKKKPWTHHWVGGQHDQNLFLDYADLDQDGLTDVIASTRSGHLSFFKRIDRSGIHWKHYKIQVPSTANEFVKAVKVGDLNGDGKLDIAFTEEFCRDALGCQWLAFEESPYDFEWVAHDIGAKLGGKYDRIELLDLDGDGDLDLLTCDEGNTNSVLWFENPHNLAPGAQPIASPTPSH